MAGMQEQAMQAGFLYFAIECGIPVFTVTGDGVTAGGCMHAYLVRTAGVDPDLHQA